jgi:hypothetical protein
MNHLSFFFKTMELFISILLTKCVFNYIFFSPHNLYNFSVNNTICICFYYYFTNLIQPSIKTIKQTKKKPKNSPVTRQRRFSSRKDSIDKKYFSEDKKITKEISKKKKVLSPQNRYKTFKSEIVFTKPKPKKKNKNFELFFTQFLFLNTGNILFQYFINFDDLIQPFTDLNAKYLNQNIQIPMHQFEKITKPQIYLTNPIFFYLQLLIFIFLMIRIFKYKTKIKITQFFNYLKFSFFFYCLRSLIYLFSNQITFSDLFLHQNSIQKSNRRRI